MLVIGLVSDQGSSNDTRVLAKYLYLSMTNAIYGPIYRDLKQAQWKNESVKDKMCLSQYSSFLFYAVETTMLHLSAF